MRLMSTVVIAVALLAGRSDGDLPGRPRGESPSPPKEDARAREARFLAANARKDGVVTLPSGLQYKVLRAGHGETPQEGDRVVCHYRGTFLDGTEFDSSYARGRPAVFAVSRVIPGWREALKLMPAGSRWQLVVPSRLAYGSRGLRGRRTAAVRIGPDATLVFDVELLAVRPPPRGGRPADGTRATFAPPSAKGG